MPFRQVTRVSTSIRNSGPRSSSRLAHRHRIHRLRDPRSAAGDRGRKPRTDGARLRTAGSGAGANFAEDPRHPPGTCPPPARLLRLSVPVRRRFRSAARPRPARTCARRQVRPRLGERNPQRPPRAATLRAHRRPPAPRRLPSPALPLPPARSARCSGRSGARRPPPLGIVRGPPAAASGPPRRPPVSPRSPPAPPQPPAPARLRGPVRFLRLRSGERGSGT